MGVSQGKTKEITPKEILKIEQKLDPRKMETYKKYFRNKTLLVFLDKDVTEDYNEEL